MNKYQEALDSVKDLRIDFIDLGYISYVTDSDIDNLKELVDKETPMKPLEDNYLGEFMCECGSPITKDHKYCPYCGQKLNWNKKRQKNEKTKIQRNN